MYELKDGFFTMSPMFLEIIDDFNKRQMERTRLLMEMLKEQRKNKKNRRKMKKHGKTI